jgi:hypothetical protein
MKRSERGCPRSRTEGSSSSASEVRSPDLSGAAMRHSAPPPRVVLQPDTSRHPSCGVRESAAKVPWVRIIGHHPTFRGFKAPQSRSPPRFSWFQTTPRPVPTPVFVVSNHAKAGPHPGFRGFKPRQGRSSTRVFVVQSGPTAVIDRVLVVQARPWPVTVPGWRSALERCQAPIQGRSLSRGLSASRNSRPSPSSA